MQSQKFEGIGQDGWLDQTIYKVQMILETTQRTGLN
jgi:hypothetical protein